eukprot:TRINITY_DN18030_c0_g1_i2.p1 TRINITY_DN18030_c0_g1~~TRINITY_DN18030_c0_g1_i2.p1  ORF type:complete len:400 (-),score=45.98 TRINITY_DN18030_c0_g1_i2:68-1267(-)
MRSWDRQRASLSWRGMVSLQLHACLGRRLWGYALLLQLLGAVGQDVKHWEVGGKPWLPLQEDGTFQLPKSVRRVFLDIGAFQSEFSKGHVTDQDDLFVIGFEPGANFYDNIRHGFLEPRFLVVPAAVASTGKSRIFHFHSEGGGYVMSSLKTLSESADVKKMPGMVQAALSVRRSKPVPIVSLESVLERIPADVRIPIVKVDAQGSDLDVVLSAGLQARRVERFLLECQDLPRGHPDILYDGQPNKQEMVLTLRAMGFALERCWVNNPLIYEENCVFVRNDIVSNFLDDCFLRHVKGKHLSLDQRDQLGIDMHAHSHCNGHMPCPPRHMRSNKVAIVEQLCCLAGDSPPGVCFDNKRTYDRCCTHVYLKKIGYLHRPRSSNFQVVPNHNQTRNFIYLYF